MLADSPRSHNGVTAAHLLNTSNVLCDVLDADRVLYGKTMRLTLDTSLVDEDTTIGGQTWSNGQPNGQPHDIS